MSKKTASTSIEDILNDSFGNTLTDGHSILDTQYKTIPVSPGLDMILGGGIPEGSFVVVTGPPKAGKAQSLDSIIYTKDGPKTMGEIEVGDILCHPNGGYTKVTNIFPQGLTDAYKVVFSDESSTICCAEHLWRVKADFDDWRTLSTRKIIDSQLSTPNRYYYKWYVPITKPVDFQEQKVIIGPYTMGQLLGKRYNHQDHIPEKYLYNTVENRWALLQGLMDANGNVGVCGDCTYVSTYLKLIQDVKTLAQSLGSVCTINTQMVTHDNKVFKSFRLTMSCDDNVMYFRSYKKREKCSKFAKFPLRRRIVNIDKLPDKIPTQCITVSAQDGLYLTDDFLVTHNSSLCLHFAGMAQKPEYACDIGREDGRHTYIFNIEGRLKSRDIRGIKHLDPSRISVISSKPGKILTGENYIDMAERLINERPGDIFILDSFSALCTEGELKSNIGDRYRADAPVLLAKFCRRISNVIPINKSIVMGITHVIANQGGGVAKWMEASGRKLQYQVDVKLKATHFGDWTVGENRVGQDVHWVCDSSALNAGPGGKFTSKLRYGHGIDIEAELFNIAIDLGLVKKGGAWFTMPSGEKLQGAENSIVYLREHPDETQKLYSQIREMLKI